MNVETLCIAMHTENEKNYYIVKIETNKIYALDENEYESKKYECVESSTKEKVDDIKDINGKYRHFKGNEYEVLGIVYDLQVNRYILYKALYDTENKFFIRPYEMFFEKTDKEKYPDAKQFYRFEKIN